MVNYGGIIKNMKISFKRYTIGERVFNVFNNSLMVIFSIMIIYPFWNMLLISFAGSVDANTLSLHIWNKTWLIDSYKFCFNEALIIRAYANTIFRTFANTFLVLFFTLLAAYPLSKKHLPFRNGIMLYFLFTMFFSGGLIPYFMLIRSIGLIDNFAVLIIPGIIGVFNIIIMRNYLMSVDKALEESAFMDGAGYFRMLFQIIAPVAKPVIATIALWTFVSNWNSWYDAMLFIRSSKKTVLQLILRELLVTDSMFLDTLSHSGLSRKIVTSNIRAAITIITIGPIVLSYPFLQKYFIKGIMMGSLKG